MGGVAGLLLGQWALQLLIALGATSFPRVAEARMDLRVLAFTVLVSLATGILFGFAPAFHASRNVTHDSLKEGGRGGTSGGGSQRLRGALVVAEVALSLTLLTGAGLLIRSFLRLQEVDTGFRPDGVLTMRVSLPEQRYSKPEQTRIFYPRIDGSHPQASRRGFRRRRHWLAADPGRLVRHHQRRYPSGSPE